MYCTISVGGRHRPTSPRCPPCTVVISLRSESNGISDTRVASDRRALTAMPARCAATTSAQNVHGGQETTLLSLYVTAMHWGSIIVAPGYTNEVKYG